MKIACTWLHTVILAVAEAVANQSERPRWNSESFFRRFATHAN